MNGPQRKEHQSSALANSNHAVQIANGVIAIAALVTLVVGGRLVIAAIPATEVTALVERHGPALVGIPAAAGGATILVGALRAINSPLDSEFLGLRVDGAGAATIAWVIVFLTVALSIRVLW